MVEFTCDNWCEVGVSYCKVTVMDELRATSHRNDNLLFMTPHTFLALE